MPEKMPIKGMIGKIIGSEKNPINLQANIGVLQVNS